MTETVGFKVSPQDYERIAEMAADHHATVSQKARELVLAGIDLPHQYMFLLQFQIVLEETVRLMLVRAQNSQRINTPEALQDIRLEALNNAPRLTLERLNTLRFLNGRIQNEQQN